MKLFKSLRRKKEAAVLASDSTSDASAGGQFYDGALNTPQRSSFVSFPLTAKREFTRYNRIEILRKIRALEANFGFISRLKSTVGKYSVGRGVLPVPQTNDEAWNEEAVQKFDDWANNRFVCDVAGAMTFWERQRFHAETFFIEAESFDAMVGSSFTGAPMLQLFDNSEIGGGYTDKDGFIDGVKTSTFGRPISFLATTQLEQFGQLQTREIAAIDMIQIVRRRRANQLRGISPFAPVVNLGIDVLDLNSLTTASAKLHEAMGIVVKQEKGDAGKGGISGDLQKLVSDGTITRVDERFHRGAAIQYLKTNENIEIVSSDRPSQNIQSYVTDYLLRMISNSTGLPVEIVWNMIDLGGATARIALADAQWFFDHLQDLLNELFNQRVWVWWCASTMNSGQLSKCKDVRWWNCHWQGPPKLTADAGRTMSGEIDGLHSGFNSWEDYYNRTQGRGWKEPIRGRIKELAWAKAECEKAGIPLEYIFAPKPGTIMMPMNGEDKTAPK